MNNVLNNQANDGTDDDGNPDSVKNIVRRLSMQMKMMVDMSDQVPWQKTAINSLILFKNDHKCDIEHNLISF